MSQYKAEINLNTIRNLLSRIYCAFLMLSIMCGICISLTIPTVAQSVVCDTLFPNPATISANLTDAELRTDQNFECNYISRLCPDLFIDSNNNGSKDQGEGNYAGVTVQLLSIDETTIYQQITVDATNNNCFFPLVNNRSYRLRVPNPPTPFSTTGGNSQDYTITNESGIVFIPFGYSTGTLNLEVPPSVTFPSRSTASISQTTDTNLNSIELIDTRLSQAGWSVTATVENFISSDTLSTLQVSNAFTASPVTVRTISGSPNGISLSGQYTITSTTDQFSIISATPGFGTGTYEIDTNISLIVPPFTPAKNYESVIVVTVI